MNYPPLRAAFVAGLLVLVLHRAASAQTAEQIIKKSQDAITSAKTVQVSIAVSGAGGTGNGTQSVDLKAIAGQKLSLNMRMSGTANGKATSGNIQMFDDGNTMYAYDANKKQYRKAPSQAKNPGVLSQALAGLTKIGAGAPGVTYKKLADKAIDGTPCFVIQMFPPANAPQAAKNIMLLYFAKSTGLMKGSDVTINMAKGPNGQPLNMKLTTRVNTIKLNAPIADTVFKFTPPPGSKEVSGAPAPGLGARPPQ